MIDKNKKYTVIGVLANNDGVTLFFNTGKTLSLIQGHELIPLIKNHIIPHVATHGYWEGYLVFEQETKNIYSEYESISSVVKFFRVAKNKVKSLLGLSEDLLEPVKVGSTKVEPTLDLVELDKILDGAEPSDSPKFNAKDFQEVVDFCEENTHEDTTQEDTVVAIVGGKPIPNAERLRGYIEASSKLKNSKGLDAFLSRLAKVIDSRGHTIQDLLVFLENAELPLANDGTIIAYKRLSLKCAIHNTYVDCHTKKIKQSVGSIVTTDIDKVDPNRKQDCSYGLHIARRSYLKSFRGDILVMVYVNPEDFIAVPSYAGSKARVCSYHIIGLIPENEADQIIRGTSAAELPVTSKLLAKAINNDIPAPKEIVTIDATNSTIVSRKSESTETEDEVTEDSQEPTLDLTPVPVVETVETAITQPEEDKQITVDEVNTVVAQTTKPKAAKPKTTKPLSYKEQVKVILGTSSKSLTEDQIAEIKAIRKKSKKGLLALGVPHKFHKQFN